MADEGAANRRHCRWCGRFVTENQQLTTRLLTDQGRRRNIAQLLCATCARGWSTESKWNHEPDPELPIGVLR